MYAAQASIFDETTSASQSTSRAREGSLHPLLFASPLRHGAAVKFQGSLKISESIYVRGLVYRPGFIFAWARICGNLGRFGLSRFISRRGQQLYHISAVSK